MSNRQRRNEKKWYLKRPSGQAQAHEVSHESSEIRLVTWLAGFALRCKKPEKAPPPITSLSSSSCMSRVRSDLWPGWLISFCDVKSLKSYQTPATVTTYFWCGLSAGCCQWIPLHVLSTQTFNSGHLHIVTYRSSWNITFNLLLTYYQNIITSVLIIRLTTRHGVVWRNLKTRNDRV